jgi:hypothetical protein
MNVSISFSEQWNFTIDVSVIKFAQPNRMECIFADFPIVSEPSGMLALFPHPARALLLDAQYV